MTDHQPYLTGLQSNNNSCVSLCVVQHAYVWTSWKDLCSSQTEAIMHELLSPALANDQVINKMCEIFGKRLENIDP